ncbi:MAG: hypothetical protein N2505_00720 [Endomicrobia bacterium]|nr:hypothetical protein [Endomicrobiia bacterium]
MRFFILIYLLTNFFSNIFTQNILDISGHFFNSFGVVYFDDVSFLKDTSYLGISTLRLNFINEFKNFIKIDGSTDFSILYGFYSELFSRLENSTKLNDNVFLEVNVRKLYIMFKYSLLDIYLGRQLLKFGEGYIFSPLNQFSKIDLKDISFSRIGSDSLRVKIQFSDTGYFEKIIISDFKSTDYVLKLNSLVWNLDTSVVSIYHKKLNWLSFGFSLKGDLVLGIWSEVLYNFAQDISKNFYSYLVGVDYSFLEKILCRIEYIYNSYNIENFLQEVMYLSNYPFISENYLATQIEFIFDFFNNLTLLSITNLTNNSNFFIFSYKRNLLQNLDLSFTLRYTTKNFFGIKDFLDFKMLTFLIGLNIKY